MIQFRKLDGFYENIDLIFVIQMCAYSECKIFYNKSSFIKNTKIYNKIRLRYYQLHKKSGTSDIN